MALNRLKKAADILPAKNGLATVSTSTSKKQDKPAGSIDAARISIANAEEWMDKGLKTPISKVIKTLVPDSIDSKSVQFNLNRLQLVGDQGLDWQQETPTNNHVGTFLVVLPLEVGGVRGRGGLIDYVM